MQVTSTDYSSSWTYEGKGKLKFIACIASKIELKQNVSKLHNQVT